jgi:hypothetical protein
VDQVADTKSGESPFRERVTNFESEFYGEVGEKRGQCVKGLIKLFDLVRLILSD